MNPNIKATILTGIVLMVVLGAIGACLNYPVLGAVLFCGLCVCMLWLFCRILVEGT